MEIKLNCFSCQTPMTFIDQISRRDECPKCMADVYCCKNCEFYDPKVYNECRETSADPVREKDRSNFCGFFKPNSKSSGNALTKEQNLKAAAEALFKKKS